MSTPLIDFSLRPLPLRLLRVQQLQARVSDPMLDANFSAKLKYPIMSAGERAASTERLLYARRRNASST